MLRFVALETERERELARLIGAHADRGVNPHLRDFFRRLFRDFLDVHAAFRRGDDDGLRARAVEQNRQIIFVLDRRSFVEVDGAHDAARGTGLLRHQRVPEHRLRGGERVFLRLRHLDAALVAVRERAFAAPARMNLRLDDVDAAGNLVDRRGEFFFFVTSNAGGNGDAEFRKELLRLIFVDVHK